MRGEAEIDDGDIAGVGMDENIFGSAWKGKGGGGRRRQSCAHERL